MRANKLLIIFFLLSFSFFTVFAEPKKSDSILEPGPKPKDRPSVALVLSGGGARGFAHLPFMELLEEMDIPVDMVIGTSIGSIVGGLYCSGYTATEIINQFDDMDWAPLFSDSTISPYENVLDAHSLKENPLAINFGTDFTVKMGTGVSNGQKVYELLKSLTLKYPSNMKFNDLKIPFRAVVTDMLDGESYVLDEGDLAEAVRASMSLPGVFEPAYIDGYYFMDGGLRYNLAINVAKNMGYDIIIAIDISPQVENNPDVFSSNPTVAILNTINIPQVVANTELYKYADLVVVPELEQYGILDFKKSHEIYAAGKVCAESKKEDFENLRKKIYPGDYDKDGNRISSYKKMKSHGSYIEKGYLVPSKLEIVNSVNQDNNYIKHSFNRLKGKEFTRERLDQFINSLYLTGNYMSVSPRVCVEDDETVLKVILKQTQTENFKVVMGGDYELTTTDYIYSGFNYNLALQARGLTGIGSVISLKGIFMNDFGGSFLYFQPFNPYLYMELESTYLSDKYSIMPFVHARDNEASSIFFDKWNSEFLFGLRTDLGNLIKFGFYFDYDSANINNFASNALVTSFIQSSGSDEFPLSKSILSDSYLKLMSFGLMNSYIVNDQSTNAFAKNGMRVEGQTKLGIPVNIFEGPKFPYLVTSISFNNSISFDSRFNINYGFFAGSEVLGTLKKIPVYIPFEGFSAYDRVYFPQVYTKDYYGINKLAGTFSLQFTPFDELTILGGELTFRITATAGTLNNDLVDFIPSENTDWKSIMWSSSFGICVNITEEFNLIFRVGAGKNTTGNVVPFFAVDIGSIKL